MQDMKLSASATLIDQSMSPYHAGEPSLSSAHVTWSAAHETNSHQALRNPHKSFTNRYFGRITGVGYFRNHISVAKSKVIEILLAREKEKAKICKSKSKTNHEISR